MNKRIFVFPGARTARRGARQASWSAWTADLWLGVEVQLARRLSASCDGEFGSAVYAKMVSPESAGSSRASYARVRSPTMGWRKRLTPVRWNWTSWAAPGPSTVGRRSGPTRDLRGHTPWP